MSVSIICCLFNEVSIAPKNLEILLTFCKKQSWSFEILIIDNNSNDGTKEWLKSLEDTDHIKRIFNKRNIGKGGSIKLGISRARYPSAIIFDLDGEYSVDDINPGLNKLRGDEHQLVLASRRLDTKKIKYLYKQNYYGVIFIDTLINLLYSTRIMDTATGLKFLKVDFYKNVKIRYSGFNVDFEIVCIALNKRTDVGMVPCDYTPRSRKEGKKINAFKDGILSIICIVHTRLAGFFSNAQSN